LGRQEGPGQPEEARRLFRGSCHRFGDADALDWDDPEHSHAEVRSKRLGISAAGRILIVVYTPRRMKNGKEIIRIISARQATRKERKAYAG